MKLFKMFFSPSSCPSDECVMVDLDKVAVKYMDGVVVGAVAVGVDLLYYVYSEKDGRIVDVEDLRTKSRAGLWWALKKLGVAETDDGRRIRCVRFRGPDEAVYEIPEDEMIPIFENGVVKSVYVGDSDLECVLAGGSSSPMPISGFDARSWEEFVVNLTLVGAWIEVPAEKKTAKKKTEKRAA